MQGRLAKYFSLLLYFALAVGGAWLTLRFVLPWAAPFIVALAIAAGLERPVRSMVRHGWRRSIAAGVLTLGMLALILCGFTVLAERGISAATGFVGRAPELMSGLSSALDGLEARAMAYADSAPEGVAEYLRTAIDAVGETMYRLPAMLSQWLIDLLARAAQASPDFLIFAVTAGIGTYFFSASFPTATAFMARQLPDGLRRRAAELGRDLKGSFGGLLRAQLILMVMTFFELLLAFMLLKIKNPVSLAAVTALIDALPVFGTGVVLVPWAVYALLTGDMGLGIGLLISWAAVYIVRNCAQAKLVGDQIGLDPIASLAGVYVGWKVCGVLGMLTFPLILVTLQQLNDRGVIKLWKR